MSHFKISRCQGVTETMRAHGYYQEIWPKLAGAAACKANSESVKFTNKILDFCQIWLGEYKGPVRLFFIIISSWVRPCEKKHIGKNYFVCLFFAFKFGKDCQDCQSLAQAKLLIIT